MEIKIKNTEKIIELNNGIPARIWEGMTSLGVPVVCLVTRISPQTTDPEKLEQFEKELEETRAPSPAACVYPLRLIL